MPAVAAGRRGVGLRGLAVVRPHAVSHRYRHLSDGRSSLAGRASAVWRWCVFPHTHRAEPPVHLSSTGGRPVQPIRLVADAGCQRRDHGANPGAADRVDGDRADRPRRMANLPTGTRAGSVTPVVVGRAHRGSGNDLLEPISSNFAFGQINVVLMTLVIVDCFPRRTPWPRGLMLGLGIALKLTPAVFLLYFLLRRDGRAALTALASFAVATLLGFVLAWRDSWEYWTHTLHHTDRIGAAALNTDQNIAGALARLTIGDDERFALWVAGSLLVLAATIWAMRRVLRAGEPTLAVICVALFGLVVSPVSWSHHWVWMLPAVLVIGLLGWRRRNVALAMLSLAGVVLMRWTPIDLLPQHRETTAVWWRQLAGMSYVWWALAVIVVAGLTVTARMTPQRSLTRGLTPAPTAS